ncbi:MAG: transketolase family protein [Acidobacteriota bacterium]|nr:transketolase family protein [Acidobacteriota bacterium]
MNTATREAFGKALAELGAIDRDIVSLDADLSCTTKSATFAQAFPDRFFNMGIAEADLMATAAGLATCGKIPFASTFAVFAACRALDQIRNSICYPGLNVKVVGTHAGPSCGEDGGSHQAVEDIAVMRSLPNMVVVVPADDVEAEAVVRAAAEHVGPMYLRFARLASPTVHEEGYEFDLFRGEVMRDGADVAIIACGMMVPRALDAARQLADEGVSARVVNMHTVKPIDEELVVRCARECGRIVTIEEASYVGGLGSAVCEVVADRCPVPVKRIGMPDCFGKSGPGAGLLDEFGLSAEHIVEVVRAL